MKKKKIFILFPFELSFVTQENDFDRGRREKFKFPQDEFEIDNFKDENSPQRD